MNVQVHSSTGSCPYKLVFSQRPRAVLFPRGFTGCGLEEDLVKDGVAVSDTSGLKCAASDSFVSSLTQAPLLGSVQPLSQYLYFITMMAQLQRWDPCVLEELVVYISSLHIYTYATCPAELSCSPFVYRRTRAPPSSDVSAPVNLCSPSPILINRYMYNIYCICIHV